MKNFDIDEADLEAIFATKKKQRQMRRFFSIPLTLLTIYAATFLVVNYQGLGENLLYWYRNDYKNASSDQMRRVISDQKRVISGGSGESTLPAIKDNHLGIATINVDAPITWQVENNDSAVRENLRNGLIHIKDTALPGEEGNVFITGHSSDLPWSKGNYKTVFALLGKVVVGDIVHLKYKEQNYLYKVREMKVVESTDLSVMQPVNGSVLTLMTCTPVGTTLRRLIVVANQVYPNPANNENQIIRDQVEKKLPRTR